MTALPLRDLTDAEKARLDAIEAAPAAEESVRERVAVALYEATEAAEYHEWPDVTGVVQNYVYTLADAAIAVLRGPSSDAEATTSSAPDPQNVRALLDRLEEAREAGLAGPWDASEPYEADGCSWVEIHGAGGYVPALVTNATDAALIVAAVNAAPALVAALRAVLDLATEWERNASVRDFGLSYLVAAERLRSIVAAAVDGAR